MSRTLSVISLRDLDASKPSPIRYATTDSLH